MNIKTQLKLGHYELSDLIMIRQQRLITELEFSDELYNRGYGDWAVSGFIRLSRRDTVHQKEFEALSKTKPLQVTLPFTDLIWGKYS